MQLEGIHHITAITGDAPRNVDFYTRVLGLRMVKKTVNQDDPSVYHLFYADEKGSAGADLTFFEYPGAAPGRAGRGMVHRVAWRVASEDALSFWAERLAGDDVAVDRPGPGLLRFRDPEGLEHELGVSTVADEPLIADHPEVPAEHALRGFDGVRAYAADPAGEPLAARGHARLHPAGRRLGGARRAARRPVRLRRAARGARPAGRGHDAPRRLGAARSRSRRSGASACSRPACGRRR